MPITTLDPKTALIVIDLQKGIVAMAADRGGPAVVEKAAAIASAFRGKGLPVFLVNVTGGAQGRTDLGITPRSFPDDFAELAPELNQQPSDILITKKTWGAFTNTELENKLREFEVTQVVILGIATSIGVESTARFAQELGFNVTIVIDALADRVEEAHHNSINIIFPRLAETGSTEELIAALIKTA